MAKKPEDSVQTAADPIVDRDADKDAAKLRGEEKALAGKIVGAKKTADEAAAEYERLRAEARANSDKLLKLVGQPSRRPTTVSEYATQEKAKGTKLVPCMIPHGFQHRLDDHAVIDVQPGVRKIPDHLANHWWFRANGCVADVDADAEA